MIDEDDVRKSLLGLRRRHAVPIDWRLLASFEAANGIMMFGWTTALLAAFIGRFAPERGGPDRGS